VFTYQGRLNHGGTPANSDYDLQFSLWDDAGSGSPPVGGLQIGTTLCADNVAVANGLFTVELDFGPTAFNGDARFLETGVRPGAVGDCTDTTAYTTLSPRQPLTSTPTAASTSATTPSSSVATAGRAGRPIRIARIEVPGGNDPVDAAINTSATATRNDADTDITVLDGSRLIGTSSSPGTTSFRGAFDGQLRQPSLFHAGERGVFGLPGWRS
jgi:hypothetical protein